MHPMRVVGVRVELPANQPVVLLREEDGVRYLPIWIGAVEASAIAFQQQGVQTVRPLTHDLLRDVIKALGVRLEAVHITEMRDDIFYAELRFARRRDGQRPAVRRDRAGAAGRGRDPRLRRGARRRRHRDPGRAGGRGRAVPGVPGHHLAGGLRLRRLSRRLQSLNLELRVTESRRVALTGCRARTYRQAMRIADRVALVPAAPWQVPATEWRRRAGAWTSFRSRAPCSPTPRCPDDATQGMIGYRGPTACSAAGITYRQLDYWARTGLVVPTIRSATGSGSQRLYSFKDILVLKVVKRLLDAGVSLQNIRIAVEALRARGVEDLAQVTLLSDGTSVYECTSSEEVVDLLRGGQGVFGIAVSGALRELRGSLAHLPGERADARRRRAGRRELSAATSCRRAASGAPPTA